MPLIRLLSCLVAIHFITVLRAANYYFSTSKGDDSRSVLLAQHPATPWKSLSKLNDFFSKLQPGDSILLNRGESFNGSIVITTSGTKGKPIVIAAYGSGAKPIITGLIPLFKWTAIGNGIFVSYDANLGSSVGTVLLDGVAKEMGRYPNSNSINKGYLTIDSYVNNISITDKELSNIPNWTGAEVVIRKQRWKIDRSLITTHNGNTINYTSGAADHAQVGFGYFIQNSIKTLDQFGEWYYNASSKKMYIYFGTNLPNTHTIEVSTANNIIYSHNTSYVTLNELTVKGAGGDGIKVEGGNNISVLNCDILFAGKIGIEAKDHSDIRIERCFVFGCNEGGINVWGYNATIKQNKISNTGLFPGMGVTYGNGLTALTCFSKKGLIENNTIINSGYIGIHFKKDSCIIRHNLIDSFCIVTDDGGGIYAYNGNNINSYDRLIYENIIMHGVGAPEGTNSTNSSAEGIYLDDNTSGVQVKNNTVTNCNYGLYLHNARDVVILNNTFFDNNIQACAAHDNLGNPIRNVRFENNILFAKLQSQIVWSFISTSNDIEDFGKFENNYYDRPIDDSITIFTSVLASEQTITNHYQLEGWKQYYRQDKQTKNSPVQIAPYIINTFVGQNKFSNGKFNNGISGIFGNNCTLAWKNDGQLDGGYLRIFPNKNGSSITMSVGELHPGKVYILKFSLIGQYGNNSIGAFLRYGESPYKPITTLQYRTISINRTEHEIMFAPFIYQSGGTLVFTPDNVNPYSLDNIQLYEANVKINKPNEYIRFEYNSSESRKNIQLDVPYIDPKNNSFYRKITLQPFTSVILMKRELEPITKGIIHSGQQKYRN